MAVMVDSRATRRPQADFRGNDNLCNVLVAKQLIVVFDKEKDSLSFVDK